MTESQGRVLLVGAALADVDLPGVQGDGTGPGLVLERVSDAFAALEALTPHLPVAVVLPADGRPVAVQEFLTEAVRRDPYLVRLVLTGAVARGRRATAAAAATAVAAAATTLGPGHVYVPPGATARDLATALLDTVAARSAVTEPAVTLGPDDDLPRRPSVHADILAATGSPEATIEDVVAVIERDVTTVSELLRVVNSAYFGMPVHVDSVERAVTLLGLEMVEALAVAGAVFGGRAAPVPGLDLAEVADRGLLVGAAARRIAQVERWSADVRSAVFVAGLLHEVGLLALAARGVPVPDGVPAPAGDPDARGDVLVHRDAAERQAWGCTVTQASAVLLREWGFGADVVQILAAQATMPRQGARAPSPHPLRSPAAQAVAVARHLAVAGAGAPLPPGPWPGAERMRLWAEPVPAPRASPSPPAPVRRGSRTRSAS